jgi:type IV pilus assembly protein PilQ
MSGQTLPRWLRRLCSLLVATLVLGLASNSGAKQAPMRVLAVKLFALDGGGAEVFVRTDRAPDYSARIAEGGKRVLLDLRGAVVDVADPAIIDPKGVVGGVMTQGFQSEGFRTARVLVQLLEPAAFRIEPHAEGLRIILMPSDKTEPMGAKKAAKKASAPSADAEPAPAAARSDDRAEPTPDEPSATPEVRDVRFDHGKESDRVVLEMQGDAGHTESARSSTRSVLEIEGARMAKRLVRTLDVSAFGGPVHAVSAYVQGTRVVIDVDHDEGASGVVTRRGAALHWVFAVGPAPSAFTGVAPDGGVARRTHAVAAEDAAGFTAIDRVLDGGPGSGSGSADDGEQTTEPDVAAAFLPSNVAQQQRFTGRRIDVDLKDADVHNVLRILADAGRVNIVASDDVSGTVTIRLKNVPWDQALDVILQAKKLGMVRRGNIIRVAPMAELNKERELAIARRKSELELAPVETRLIPVSYASAADLQARAKDLLSPRGSVAVDERTNVLIARDVGGNLNQIEELIRALDTQTPQVLIEARIVEATSSFRRDVGIQWGGDVTFSPGTGNETGLFFPSSVGIVGGASDQQTPTAGLSPLQNVVPNPNFAVNLPATVGTGAGGALGLSFGSIDNTVNLAVRLSAAEATGMLRIVSSPRILTLDNHEARIAQGTLIPFSQISAQGVQTVFQEAKLQLLVQPHVTADGSVSMHVKINRDEPDFNQTSARGDPTILKREAETELLVRDGHTAVIGGIYARNTGRNLDQVPLLGDIPVLGVLFQRRRSSDVRSELVIFLTPRIVNRAEALGR